VYCIWNSLNTTGTKQRRKLRNEELGDMYSSSNIIRAIKSRRMRWVEHVTRMGRDEMYTGFCWENLKERYHLEGLGLDGRIILRWFFKWDGGLSVAYPGILFGGWGEFQQIQLRTEDRENGDLGAVAPQSGVLEAVVIWYKKFHLLQQNLNFWYFKNIYDDNQFFFHC